MPVQNSANRPLQMPQAASRPPSRPSKAPNW
ncbi:Uncharacterised protein [Bordetella pertussis]|nr:Uncharacterised protein [Bordetella pertussis]